MIIMAFEKVEDGKVPGDGDSVLYMIDGVVQGVYHVLDAPPELERKLQELRDQY